MEHSSLSHKPHKSLDPVVLPSRWVVLDTETTGVIATRDQIVSIGAVAVSDTEIQPQDSFECVIRQPYNSSSVVVHGITQDESERRGTSESEALQAFSDFIKDACLVGHHVEFDVTILNHRMKHKTGRGVSNPFLDTMELVIAMEEAKWIDPRPSPNDFGLDALCRHFNVKRSGRHTAPGDAFITALVFIRLLSIAANREPDMVRRLIHPGIPPSE